MLVEYKKMVRAILRIANEFGFETYDRLSPPRRLFGTTVTIPLIEQNVDKRRVRSLDTPAQLLGALPENDNWLAMSGRTLGRLYVAFLIAEDPQRRLDAHKAATLMHQISLVRHILNQPDLRKVMIGDEVGLGKTIEAGLLIRRLFDQNPRLRVIYLAPARLVSNVVHEFRDKLDLDARKWVAGNMGDARLDSDCLVVASINKAVFGDNLEKVAKSGPWDVIIVDECHHLSDWGEDGGNPNQAFKLVSQLTKAQSCEGRLILMSGTPHQGSKARFKNLLRLLADDGKSLAGANGRVIFRTKDRVRDWHNQPLFPSRDIRQTTVVKLGDQYENWYAGIAMLYDQASHNNFKARATGWAKGQALQWAASSVQAGLGFLVRLAMRRLSWGLSSRQLTIAIEALRPYRGGSFDEPLESLYARLKKQIGLQAESDDSVSDSEDIENETWVPNPDLLSSLLDQGVKLLKTDVADAKWEALCQRIIEKAGDEKIVLFAQPVETVGVVAQFLEKRYGVKPAIIIGNQSEEDRLAQINHFQTDQGPRFLVSSRAGGEGLNMQRSRRLVHLDVPWNPMEMEQRVGRVHRFGSRKTIIVDTVVAAGSREVDMYRIARDKLALIATQLDPEQFEILFSRVMSLVPPKELEEIISGAAPGPLGSYESSEIGRLVTEGFRSWNSFNETYRHEADRIRAMDSGQASWADLGHFLVKHGNAEPVDEVSLATFEFRNNQIESVEEQLPAIRLGKNVYVCGNTNGLPVETRAGSKAYALGINLEEILAVMRNTFFPDRDVGAALVRRSKELDIHLPMDTVSLITLLRHSIRYEGGNSNESNLSLHLFAVNTEFQQTELSTIARANTIRLLMQSQRVRDMEIILETEKMAEIEQSLIDHFQRLTEDDISMGIRHAVWLIAVIRLI